jgi:carboxyl-terminal processing protease
MERKLLVGLLVVIMAVAIGSAGFMMGYASGQSIAPAPALARVANDGTQSNEPAPTQAPASSAAVSSSEDADFQIFWEAYQKLKQEYYGDDLPVTTTLAYDAIQGVIFGLKDQFTSFLPPAAAKLAEEDQTGSFSGIGAYVQLNKQRALQITRVFPDSPAEKAGLKSGDLIISVGGETIVGQDLSVQVAKVRGPAGSKVTLTVVRGEEKPFDVEVIRATIEIKLVESKMLDNQIAYVSLSKFDSVTTADELNAAIKGQLAQNPRGLILDLRDNPGGLLSQAIAVADIFLKKGVVVIERSKNGDANTAEATDAGIAQDIPLVVLVNSGSASAAEIVAGAIQDRGRGKLIGVTTFGKGSVQQVNPLSDGSQLRVTIAHWFTPNNREIHGKGLEPDITVEAGSDPSKDPQLDRAVEFLLTGK